MSPKRRVGLAGFGHLGQHLYANLPEDDYEIAFVWNRTKSASLEAQVRHDLILDSLDDFAERQADLIVEVAHPDVTRKFGPQFVRSADYMIGSPTALADDQVMEQLKQAATEHGVYVPAGALWGGEDIRKMDQLGNLNDGLPDRDGDGEATNKSSWRRQRMTTETVQELEAEFLKNPKPSRQEIEDISGRLGQKEINIYAWFYRRRHKDTAKDVDRKSSESAEEEKSNQDFKKEKSARKAKRRKSQFTRLFGKEERTVLENVFMRQSHPGASEIAGLSRWFQKDEKKISTWFARRRLKFTKDFVKNIDADSYSQPPFASPLDVTPTESQGTSEEQYKYIPTRTPKIEYSTVSDDDDEVCDVEHISSSDSENDNFKVKRFAREPETPALQSCTRIPVLFGDGATSTRNSNSEIDLRRDISRETVLKWAVEPTTRRNSNGFAPGSLGPAIEGRQVIKIHEQRHPNEKLHVNPPSVHKTHQNVEGNVESPGLVPVEWFLKQPAYLPFPWRVNSDTSGYVVSSCCVPTPKVHRTHPVVSKHENNCYISHFRQNYERN